ncbi:MAG TPA: redoxin domain-containing protein [Phycisphaerales bacterium]|nr:redoxin domain-containing protein [Phycisphaerales bacterium]
MRTLALSLILATTAAAQPPADPTPPPAAPPVQPQAPAPTAPDAPPAPPPPAAVNPKPGDIAPEAQAIFDRAIAVYRGAKFYRESVTTVLHQQVAGLPKDAEPPADQASTTAFIYAAPDRFAFDTRDFGLYRDGKQSTILVKVLGEYTQRETTPDDQRVFANMVDVHPVYQALTAGEPGKTIGRFATAATVTPETVRGVKGKRISGTGLPPLPGFEVLSPVSMFFADDTGLLLQAVYDLKAIQQSRVDQSLRQTGNAARVLIEEFSITSDWTEAKVETEVPGDTASLVFKPGPRDKKVADFNMSDGDTSVQHSVLNTEAPGFTGKTLAGKAVSLKELKGRVVLLQFWTGANAASTNALTVFNSMNIVYGPKGVAMIGVNIDHPLMADQSRRVVDAKKAAYPQILDGDKSIANAYRVALTPCTIIIDKEGVIRSISSDFDAASQIDIAAKLDALLEGKPIPATVKPAPFTPPVQPPPPPPGPPALDPAQPRNP